MRVIAPLVQSQRDLSSCHLQPGSIKRIELLLPVDYFLQLRPGASQDDASMLGVLHARAIVEPWCEGQDNNRIGLTTARSAAI
jgi:hypothetical protein